MTRTGRSFFSVDGMEEAFLARMRSALGATGLWDALDAGWVLLDAEIMPWSLKAEELLRTQYASVGAAASSAVNAKVATARRAVERGIDVGDILARAQTQRADVDGFIDV